MTYQSLQTESIQPCTEIPEPLSSQDSTETHESYRIWACDNQLYGPVLLDILAEWVREQRVLRNTWIYVETRQAWCQAESIEQLQEAFPPSEDTVFLERQSMSTNSIDPYELRTFPALAGLSNHDLAYLIKRAELVVANPGDVIIRRHEPGDAIYFILSGSVRAQITVGFEERILGKIPSGQFFGEMAMFTQTPRAADIIAEEDARLLRFTAAAFRSLIVENPLTAAPMLYAFSTSMAQRLLDTNKIYQLEVAQSFVWR